MFKKLEGGVTLPKGFHASGVKAGIKKVGKIDLGIIFSTTPAAAAALYTTNKMAAAPVIVSRAAAPEGYASAVVVNSGCANACTGEVGLADAKTMAQVTAEALRIKTEDVLVASTGVIGVNLPMEKIVAGIKEAALALSDKNDADIQAAIMTTDTIPKASAYEFELDGKLVKIAGISKGSGMIHPNMATTLSFITTDAAISPAILKKALIHANELSFNMITVDGDTSTNDMVSVLANGLAENKLIDSEGSPAYGVFAEALTKVCVDLAKLIVKDGEGATKFLEIKVTEALTFEDAKEAAMTVAKSPLVKTAFFGQDPNWGRILCAVGYSKASVDPQKVSLSIGPMSIVTNGLKTPQVDTDALTKIMSAKEIAINIKLGLGSAEATVWTCDLSYEYVKINGEYTT